MKNKLGYKKFLLVKHQLQLQGLELFEDGEIWNRKSGKKVAELSDVNCIIEDGKVDVFIKTEAALDFIFVNISLEKK